MSFPKTVFLNKLHEATVIGISGKMASGKSTVSRVFHNIGYPVFDADVCARRLQETDEIVQKKIQKSFPEVFDFKHKIDRQKLRFSVLKDKNSLMAMEGIVFPHVRKAASCFIRKHQQEKILVLDVPLLWASKIDLLCDEIIYISCSEKIRNERIAQRSIFSNSEVALIEKRQQEEERYLTKEVHFLSGEIPPKKIEKDLISFFRKQGNRT
ncbi:dephospho-CoA kinase [Acetobacteraceae bacterium]|nr:dephospho-CoA kinase [Acetobacteraceae bacterium]